MSNKNFRETVYRLMSNHDDCSQFDGLGKVSKGIEPPYDLLYYKRTKTERLNMHYRNGREAKNGDKIVQLDYDKGTVTAFGVLHSAIAGDSYCNGNIAPVQNALTTACICDCIHVDDLAALLKEKGLDKRPSGK